DLAHDPEVALGLGVEVEVEQQAHLRPAALAQRLQVRADVAENRAVDVELRLERRAEAGPPALRVAAARLVEEDVGLARAATLRARFPCNRLDAVEIGDGRLVPGGVIDAPGGAVRPVDPELIAYLAPEELVAGHAERLGLGVEQRILDGAERLADHAA